MTHLLVLDSSVVGAITNPKQTSPIIRDCQIWFRRSLERQSIGIINLCKNPIGIRITAHLVFDKFGNII